MPAPGHAEAEQGSQGLADVEPGPTNPQDPTSGARMDDQQALHVGAGTAKLGAAGRPGPASPVALVRELLLPDDQRALLVASAGLRVSLLLSRADLLRVRAELAEERARAASAAQARHRAILAFTCYCCELMRLARSRPLHATQRFPEQM